MTAETAPAERTFRFLDHFALWATLGVSLYLMPFGSLLVPALSIERAVLATVTAAFIAALLVAAVASLAARSGLSTAGLLAGLFGERASPVLAALLLVRNVVFGGLALSLIAGAAALVSERALGAGLRPLWVIAFGLLGLALLLAGRDFVVRRLLRRGGVWLVLLIATVIALSAYMEFEVPAYLKRPAAGGWPSFWQAVDIMLVAPLLWLPLVADYARFGKSAGSAAAGSFAGLFVGTVWLGVLGIIYLPAVESGDVAGFVVGMKMGVGALVLLAVLQLDEVFANGYSASLAAGSLVRLDRRKIAVGVAAITIALAVPFDFLDFEPSVLLLGSAFVPLFGVLIADRLLESAGAGRPFGWAPWLAWVCGFVLYQWITPADIGWWRDAGDAAFGDALGLPFPLGDEATWLGAAVPSFLLGFALQCAGRWTAAALGTLLGPAPAAGTR
ncbi:MAG: hypothetical protein Q7T33_11225 [Dehalococcoidia bacterium]|nr:hypothetical protein [Dehalococcoidia bacterium]